MTVLFGVLMAMAPVGSMCSPLTGSERLWPDQVGWVVVGEEHGTVEMPQQFAQIACNALTTRRRVIVVLEQAAENQPWINEFIAAPDTPESRTKLLSAPMWHQPVKDGRSSRAIYSMLTRLAELAKRSRRLTVLAYDGSDTDLRGGDRERLMATYLERLRTSPDQLVIGLFGNVHAMVKPIDVGNQGFMPMAGLLPRAATLGVTIRGNGGTRWSCDMDKCGVTSASQHVAMRKSIKIAKGAAAAWDVVFELGQSTTYSRPMTGGPDGVSKTD